MAAAGMGFAHSGVRDKSADPTIFPRFMRSTSFGLGVCVVDLSLKLAKT